MNSKREDLDDGVLTVTAVQEIELTDDDLMTDDPAGAELALELDLEWDIHESTTKRVSRSYPAPRGMGTSDDAA